jgi:hypothetical protein
MKIIFSILFFTAISFKLFAADTIIVHRDERLNLLTAKEISINQTTAHLTSSGQYKGYRLQVLVTQNRDDAFKAKAVLLQNFPDQKAYVIYQSPNFKVRFGNFINIADAQKMKPLLAQQYPSGVYIVEDAVEYFPSNNAAPQSNE